MRIAALTRPLPGESHNGDAYFIAVTGHDGTLKQVSTSAQQGAGRPVKPETVELGDDDSVLVAVVDGTGHGEEAAHAAQTIVGCLHDNHQLELSQLVRYCHDIAHSTRGAALVLARFDQPWSRIRFISVGDVDVQIGTPHGSSPKKRSTLSLTRSMHVDTIINNYGIVGYNLPKQLFQTTHAYAPGDVIVLYSDGIAKDFSLGNMPNIELLPPEAIVDATYPERFLGTDDATMLVMR